jgi:hypothetical protein
MSGSALRKYMSRAVGSNRYRDLLAYQAAKTFCRGLPGAAGIFLRRIVYRRLLGAFGKNSTDFEGGIFRCPKQIFIEVESGWVGEYQFLMGFVSARVRWFRRGLSLPGRL